MEHRKHQTLSMVQNARLVNLLEAEFAASKMTDAAFAAHAQEKLGCEVNKQHINNRRQELGIPSYREAKAPGELLEVSQRLSSCEMQLAADQKEFRGLTILVIEMEKRLNLLEKAACLKGTFELPLEPPRVTK